MTDADCQNGPAPNPILHVRAADSTIPSALSLDSEGDKPMDEARGAGEFDHASQRDSQDSAISDLALDTRRRAFQAVMENARNRTGWEIGLLSTTDNHSSVDNELTYRG